MRWHTPALCTDTDVVSRASVKRNKTARATRKEDFKWKCFSRHLKEVAEPITGRSGNGVVRAKEGAHVELE